MTLRVYKNPDEKLVKEIKQAIKDNKGYCPCSLERNKNTKCMCKAFKEQEIQGYCHCGLFYKEFLED